MSERDRIERVILLPVPIDRAWRAIADPAELSQWFGTGAEIDLRPGGEAFFEFGDIGGKARILIVEPQYRLVWENHPTGEVDPALPLDDVPLTRVEFSLESVRGGTRLTLIESGFAALPPDLRDRAYEGNQGGWDHELGELIAYAESLRT